MSAPHYFPNARDWNVGSITINNTNSSRDLERAFQRLYDNIAIDAAHNSAERRDAPKCHEDTRKAVQEEIHGWITHGDEDPQPMKILHLTGPAGTGKTAIAGSIAGSCDDDDLLAGTFFFASFIASETRRSKRCFVATLVYHLISPLNDKHPIRLAILSAVQRDPSIFRKQLRDQFKFLLVKPFNDTRDLFDASTLPKVFIIDGLDEVEAANSRQPDRDPHDVRRENEADQEEILSALLYASNSAAFPFRIIVASRPERAIQTFFHNRANNVTRKVFLDAKYNPDSDIRLFLIAKFSEIRRRYRLPASWPSEEDIQGLVSKASGQFIYAATVIRFLESGKHRDIKDLLKTLMGLGSQDKFGALAPLDALYSHILQSSPDPPLVARWIWPIDYSEGRSATFFNQLLQDYEGQAQDLLENLASLVGIPPVDDQSSPYRFYHKSFFDFLRAEDRCGPTLAHAFRSAQEFYYERCVDILMNKSPAIPLQSPGQKTFLYDFLKGLSSDSVTLISQSMSSEELVQCDVVWWVDFAVVNLSYVACHVVSELFSGIHGACLKAFPGDCVPHCKHWRSNILRACKELGWDAPNAIALFRERLFDSAWKAINANDLWVPEPYFLPPGDEPQPSLLVTPTQYTVSEEYQATLDLIAEMYSHLPADWESQFVEEAKHNEQVLYRGLTDVIEGIRQELGIETPDVLVSWGSDDGDSSDNESDDAEDSDDDTD